MEKDFTSTVVKRTQQGQDLFSKQTYMVAGRVTTAWVGNAYNIFSVAGMGNNYSQDSTNISVDCYFSWLHALS